MNFNFTQIYMCKGNVSYVAGGGQKENEMDYQGFSSYGL